MKRKLSYKEIFEQRPTLAELLKKKRYPIYGLLENVRSLYNVGSVFRTSDAIRLQCLYLTGYTGIPPRREIDKTALGAVDSVFWKHSENAVDTVAELKKKKMNILALEHTTDSMPYSEFMYRFPVCIMFGNEVEGLSEELIDLADAAIEIPMYGLKQSLNISVAYGIVMYHVLNTYLDCVTKDK
jgi:tRNA G18 (ribose-2'-O)-methylase SpoU